jgi:hypothetical protein
MLQGGTTPAFHTGQHSAAKWEIRRGAPAARSTPPGHRWPSHLSMPPSCARHLHRCHTAFQHIDDSARGLHIVLAALFRRPPKDCCHRVLRGAISGQPSQQWWHFLKQRQQMQPRPKQLNAPMAPYT